MEVGIVAQYGSERAIDLAADVRERLLGDDVPVAVDESTADALDVDGQPTGALSTCDLVVSIGGDGTFLYAARASAPAPILGVNLGEVGFLNAVSPAGAIDEVLAAVAAVEAGDLAVDTVPRLRASGSDWSLDPAINEVLVQGPRRGPGGAASIEIRVDGDTYVETDADGVLVATPTGSTAYNLSEGGPLVHPDADVTIVTPMFPREGARSLVVDGDATVDLHVTDADVAYAVVDGRRTRELTPPTTVHVTEADEPLRLAGPSVEFFEALEKLE